MKISESHIRVVIREILEEAKKRDYKAEYKKYGSSKKAKKYRAELNKYNRDKGTYGNGDKKDASHKGGKIVGFEEQSKNRGRREKSRLKKKKVNEVVSKLNEKMSKSQIKKMRKDFDRTGKLPPHLQKLADLMKKNTKVKDIVVPGLEWMADIKEDFGSPVKQLPSFSSKEAKKVVDDGLKDWAKVLRKAQHKVIKDWLSKAKSGALDYFDLVRGIQTGDARRAHPNETKFLHSLLNKNKIMNRFKSYYGGKKGIKRGK
tara:strand:+ start:2259 stop:3035 length:777 start_codon:yes stop_codon:yes gene_type:complete